MIELRWYAMLAASFLALNMIACRMAPPPVGFILDVADAPESCGDGRTVVAKAIGSASKAARIPISFVRCPTEYETTP